MVRRHVGGATPICDGIINVFTAKLIIIQSVCANCQDTLNDLMYSKCTIKVYVHLAKTGENNQMFDPTEAQCIE